MAKKKLPNLIDLFLDRIQKASPKQTDDPFILHFFAWSRSLDQETEESLEIFLENPDDPTHLPTITNTIMTYLEENPDAKRDLGGSDLTIDQPSESDLDRDTGSGDIQVRGSSGFGSYEPPNPGGPHGGGGGLED